MDLGKFFTKSSAQTIALIDIGSSSVGGALARIEKGTKPILLFTERVPIEAKSGRSLSECMLEALDGLGQSLLVKGAPILREQTGHGSVDAVFASISSPWQKTHVDAKVIEESKPFLFTKAHIALSEAQEEVPEGFLRTEQSVIAVLLNGYEVRQPFGKKVKRADLVLLSSLLDTLVTTAIQNKLHTWYHTHNVHLSAFAPIAYEAYRDTFPHQKDFVLLHVGGEATDLAFVKNGLLVDVASVPSGLRTIMRAAHTTEGGLHGSGGDVIDPALNTHFSMRVKEAQDAWVKQLTDTFRDFSSRHALSRTLFLLSEEGTSEYVKRLLNATDMHALWLSDDPLTVLPSVPSLWSTYVQVKGEAKGDVLLMMLALAYEKRGSGK